MGNKFIFRSLFAGYRYAAVKKGLGGEAVSDSLLAVSAGMWQSESPAQN
jgi:hypothetical protein